MAMFGSSWKEDTCSPCGFGDYSCCLCASSGNGCLAAMDDNYFTPATDAQLLERVKSGRYNAENTELMATVLRNHGVTTGDYKRQSEDKCTATDSLAEAINKCNKQLENKPILDFSGVKVDKGTTSLQEVLDECCECMHSGLKYGDTVFMSIDADRSVVYLKIKDIQYCPLCGKKLGVEDNG